MSDLLTTHMASAVLSTFLGAEQDSATDISQNATTQEFLNSPASISRMASLFLAGKDSETNDEDDALPDDTNISIELNQPHWPVNLPASLSDISNLFLDSNNLENDDNDEMNIISSNEPNQLPNVLPSVCDMASMFLDSNDSVNDEDPCPLPSSSVPKHPDVLAGSTMHSDIFSGNQTTLHWVYPSYSC